jgi:hypothetical protein
MTKEAVVDLIGTERRKGWPGRLGRIAIIVVGGAFAAAVLWAIVVAVMFLFAIAAFLTTPWSF